MAKPEVDHSGISAPSGNGGSDTLNALQAALDPPAKKAAPNPFADVIVGKEFSAPKILAYGIDGIGKSTFASQAPKPIVIQTEEGQKQIGAARFPICRTYPDFLGRLNSVATANHDYQTLVIDGASGLEKLIYDKVASDNGKANIDLVGGGFDKGQKLAMTQWLEVLQGIDRCWEHGMAIIVLAHARSEDIGDPENPMAKQYAPALHKKTSGEMFRRWADATLFFTRRMTTRKEGDGIMAKTIAVPVGPDGGERIIRTTWTPTAVAKNRYDMPSELPFPRNGSWDLVMCYIADFYNKKG